MLAELVTRLVHGDEGLVAAQRITQSLFSGALSELTEQDLAQLAQDGMPGVELESGQDLQQALVDAELAPSRGQARKLIDAKSVSINGELQTNAEYTFSADDRLYGRYTLLRRGKKNYSLISWK